MGRRIATNQNVRLGGGVVREISSYDGLELAKSDHLLSVFMWNR